MEQKLYPKKSKKPLQAIKYQCYECMGWDRREEKGEKPVEDVRGCTDLMCPLYDFRFGKNPYHTSTAKGNIDALRKYHKTKQATTNLERG